MSISASYPTLRPTLLLDFANSGRLDPRVTFSRASTATYFDETGVLQSAAIDAPRFDYDPATLAARGFLIEEQRTNSIRNNTMQGAVAGSPGTLPTNWTFFEAGSELTSEVVATGTENGIAYIDIKVSGTVTAQRSALIFFETTTGIGASASQSWTQSLYLKLQAGSTANIEQINTRTDYYSSVPAFLSSSVGSALTVTSAALNTQRQVNSVTTPASTAFIQPMVRVRSNASGAIDITLRIGLPQLELGAFATSVIPTTTTALTRSADVASVNTLSPWYNASASTFYAEWSRDAIVSSAAFPRPFNIINTASTDNLAIAHVNNQTSTTSQPIYTAGVSWPFTSVTADPTLGVKAAVAVEAGSGRYAVNGTLGGSDYALPLIPAFNQLNLGGGKGFLPNNHLNGWIRRITYYPRRLSNAELVSITS